MGAFSHEELLYNARYNNNVKTESDIIHYASKSDYLNRTAVKLAKAGKAVPEGLKTISIDKVDVSEEAKSKIKETKNPIKEVANKVKDKVGEAGSAGKHLLGQAAEALSKSIPSIPGLPTVKISDSTKVKSVEKVNIKVDKPGIFFVKGFSINPFEDDMEGLTGIAKNIPGTKTFNWNQEDELIEEIKNRPHTQPIILVAHGMGADTATSVANKLNTIGNAFHQVDLLVTLDSVGLDNDIIPQNVRKNINFIGYKNGLLNDGPNIAKNKGLTSVQNELTEHEHDDLPKSVDIQFNIYESINEVLNKAVQKRDMTMAKLKVLMDKNSLPSTNQKSLSVDQ